MKRNVQGKFALKNKDYRKVRSLRLTDSTWQVLGIASECFGLTRADYLEQIIRDNALPSNTRTKEEIDILKAHIQNLIQENATLTQRATVAFPQAVELEILRERILLELKLGKQAPGYTTAQKALNRFIAELTQQ